MREVVAHVKIPYLPGSETFIYELITGVYPNYPGIVVTAKEMKNLERFPFSEVYHFEDFGNLAPFLEEKGVSLIHGHFGVGGTRVLEVKKKTGLPLITSFHGVDAFALPETNAEYRENLNRLFAEGELFTAVSRFMAKRLIELGCPEHKIRVFHCGIDLAKFQYQPRTLPQKGEPWQILSVGRLKEKKGMSVLVEAFAKVVQEIPDTRLTIVGEGGQRKRLERMIKELGLAGIVTLTGELTHSEVAALMGKAHIFCLASLTAKDGDREGIPVVLMEAMAAGVPVVSTYHSGIPELISDGVNGLLAQEADSGDLAEKLLMLLNWPQLWPDFTAEARSVIEAQFNIEKQVPQLERFYELVSERGKEPPCE